MEQFEEWKSQMKRLRQRILYTIDIVTDQPNLTHRMVKDLEKKVGHLRFKLDSVEEEMYDTLEGEVLRHCMANFHRFAEKVSRRLEEIRQPFLEEFSALASPRGSLGQSTNPTLVGGIRAVEPKLECPTFSGEDKDNMFAFRDFLSRFNFCIGTLSKPADRLLLLKTRLTGKAFQLIHHIEETDTNYDVALDMLKREYFDERLIRSAILERIIDYVPKSDRSHSDVKDFFSLTRFNLRELDRSFGYRLTEEGSSGDLVLSLILFRKLPSEVKRELISRAHTNFPSLNFILDNTEEVITTLNFTQAEPPPHMVRASSKAADRSQPGHTKISPRLKTPKPMSTLSTFQNMESWCNFCFKEGHASINCLRYSTHDSRVKRCKEMKICPLCMGTHFQEECMGSIEKRFRPCVVCGSRAHYGAMCSDYTAPAATNINVCMSRCEKTFFLPIFHLKVTRGKHTISVPCLLDTGSQRSFFSTRVLEALKCPSESVTEVTLSLQSFLTSGEGKYKQACIQAQLDRGKRRLVQVLFMENFHISCGDRDCCSILQELRSSGYHLQEELSAESYFHTEGLIGVDLIQYLGEFERVKCMDGYALKVGEYIIPFGDKANFLLSPQPTQKVAGVRPSFEEAVQAVASCPEALVYNVLNPIPSYVDPYKDQFQESLVDRGLDYIFSLESMGLPENDTLSCYDEEMVAQFRDSIKCVDGRYLVDLPWDPDQLKRVPSNHTVALQVMKRVAKRLTERGQYQEYLEEFKKQEKEGIIEEIEVDPSEFSKYIWIPHRPVYKTDVNSTTKVRPVFNCSLKGKNGISLNDAAYPGINMTGDMLRLLLLFRSNKFVLLGDIRKAFLMIRLAKVEDKNRFCFFLKEGEVLRCFRYNTIIFGFIASPFILNYVLKYHARQFPLDDCSRMLMADFYVDNLIKTSNSLESLVPLYSQAVSRLKEGGFSLRSCNSNSKEMRDLMKEDGTFVEHESAQEKVLGYEYNPETDRVNVSFRECNPYVETKRGILSEASKVFDPLSLCLPVTIRSRILIGELWRLGLGWDEIVPAEQQKYWKDLSQDLNRIYNLSFKREALRGDEPADLYVFSDASKSAYGFVVYAVQGGVPSIVFAKAKMAPLPERTLPSLELLAVFLAVKCVKTLLGIFPKGAIRSVFLATDSQVALSWVTTKEVGDRKKVFIKNRLREISIMEKEIKSVWDLGIQYRYVSTSENPADMLTRGLSVEKFQKNLDFWSFGPEWMRQKIVSWPTNDLCCLSDQSKKLVQVGFCQERDDERRSTPVIDFERFSSVTKLFNTTKLVFSFLARCRKRPDDSDQASRNYLFTIMQIQSFPEEVAFLRDASVRLVPSLVRKLGLFLDADGIMRAKGRIGKSVHQYEVIHPILLGKNHPLTKLIIRDCHKQATHMGLDATLSQVRLAGYWIPQIRQAVNSVLSSCPVCRRYNYGPYEVPRSPDLPEHRVHLIRPFLHTGIDFTGHVYVTEGENNVKMYILVFTCLNVRAVHLELVKDMTVQEFMMAFIRFTNTYGVPSHLYSDNAKTFLAAGDLLRKARSSEEYSDRFGTCAIKHITVPMYSAWYGGLWERMIKTIKACLHKLIGRKRLSYFELLTVLSDVQRAVNDRPLTYRSSSDSGLEILTPNHFLNLSPNARLIVRATDIPLDRAEPPSRRMLLRTLEARDEALTRFRQLWHDGYLLGLRDLHRDLYQSPFANKIREGQIVSIKRPNKPRPFWSLGKVVHLFAGNDGFVRSAEVLTGDGETKTYSLKHLFPLELTCANESPAREQASSRRSVSLEDSPGSSVYSPPGDVALQDSSASEVRPDEEEEYICPICEHPWGGHDVICCDGCEEWFHFACIGMNVPPPEEDEWFCQSCANEGPAREQASARRSVSLGDSPGSFGYGPSGDLALPDSSTSEVRPDEEEYICPICKYPWGGHDVICCDGCEEWFHFACIGMNVPPPEEEEWFCQGCVSQPGTSTICLVKGWDTHPLPHN